MTTRSRIRSAVLFGLLTSLLGPTGREAKAQGYTADPYNIVGEYNSQYEPFMYATQPTDNGVFPNQSRMMERNGVRAANRFQSFSDSLDGAEPNDAPAGALRRSGAGTPYYRAFRQFDQDFDRLYRPNKDADSTFYNGLNQRNQKYFEAMRETDPRKRSQLLRDYNLDNMKAARGLSNNRNTPERDRATASSTAATGSSPTGSAASLTTPGGRRTSSPLPALPNRPRASSSPRPLGRAPGATTRANDGASPADVLKRSELLERANRLTAPRPSSTRTPAPPPR